MELQEEAVGNKVQDTSGADKGFATIQKKGNEEPSKIKTLRTQNKDSAWEMFRNKIEECSCVECKKQKTVQNDGKGQNLTAREAGAKDQHGQKGGGNQKEDEFNFENFI